jgi:WD40 repeat protein
VAGVHTHRDDFRPDTGTSAQELHASPSGETLDFGPVALAWSPDSRQLATTGGARRAPLYIWNVKTEKRTGTLRPQPTPGSTGMPIINMLAWSPDGRRLASQASGPRLTVAVWDLVTGKMLHVWDAAGMAWSPCFARPILARFASDESKTLEGLAAGWEYRVATPASTRSRT